MDIFLAKINENWPKSMKAGQNQNLRCHLSFVFFCFQQQIWDNNSRLQNFSTIFSSTLLIWSQKYFISILVQESSSFSFLRLSHLFKRSSCVGSSVRISGMTFQRVSKGFPEFSLTVLEPELIMSDERSLSISQWLSRFSLFLLAPGLGLFKVAIGEIIAPKEMMMMILLFFWLQGLEPVFTRSSLFKQSGSVKSAAMKQKVKTIFFLF